MSSLMQLRKLFNDKRAESNVLVAIVTVVVAVSKLVLEATSTILIIIAAKSFTLRVNDADSSSAQLPLQSTIQV